MLSANDLTELIQGYDRDPAKSYSLGAQSYTDERFLTIERECIFYRSWQWVCHVEKLREPGSYCVTDVQGRSIALVRDTTGTLRAFYNVCKHRAHELLKGEGKAKLIVCPYHAWSYDRAGALKGIPDQRNFPGIKPEEYGLIPLPLVERHGMIWVLPDPGGEIDLDALDRLLGDPTESTRLGDNGRRTVEEKLTWNGVALQMQRRYEEILRQS